MEHLRKKLKFSSHFDEGFFIRNLESKGLFLWNRAQTAVLNLIKIWSLIRIEINHMQFSYVLTFEIGIIFKGFFTGRGGGRCGRMGCNLKELTNITKFVLPS